MAVKNRIVCCYVQYLEHMGASACSDAAQRVTGAVCCAMVVQERMNWL